MKALIVIPARMASSRLPGKPLAQIAGEPMIVHVWRKAMAAGADRVVVAAAEAEVADAVRAAGGEVVMTDPGHPSGSDRVHEAAETVDPDGRFDLVVNLQGDLPTIEPAVIHAVLTPFEAAPAPDIATLAVRIPDDDEAERTDPHVVKAVLSFAEADPAPGAIGRALYFTRASAPTGGAQYHHIGLYAFRRAALDQFVALPPSPLELQERLEQLRALEAGMTIAAALVDSVPDGVDTPADLERARARLAPGGAP